MKKFYSLALILISLFSCIVFSACGDKYKKLKMDFYSSDGEKLDVVEFVIDSNSLSLSKTIGIEFSHIDEDDIGQVVIYSLPNELVTVSNYKYRNNKCYVDINPNMPSGEDAKLVVSHLASGKKAQIDLQIDKKSNNLNVINSKYLISIPQDGEKEHAIDFSQIVSLLPAGSTDKVYFKMISNPANVEPIALEDEALAGLYSGFKVKSSMADSTDATCVKIYPVTRMKGYEDENVDKYINKEISIYFKKTLNNDNLSVVPVENNNVDLNNLKLIANDGKLSEIKLTLKYNDIDLNNTAFVNMYEIQLSSADPAKVSTFLEGNNNILISANAYTEDFVTVNILLKPINFVGELEPVEKSIKVKGEIRSDTIQVVKNGELISINERTNIFDYYEEGNSLGSLFNFKAIASSGLDVHEDLTAMQILVSPEILCEENCDGEKPVKLNSMLYSLMFHNYNEYLKFTYDSNLKMMVSETIYDTSRVYIKYVDGNGTIEPTNFGINVRTTVSDDAIEFWKSIEPTNINLNFNRLEGVKEMTVEAGFYGVIDGADAAEYHPLGENPKYIYLNRLEGVDNASIDVKFINLENGSVKGIDGGEISKVDFNVTITPLNSVQNPLKIVSGLADSSTSGESEIVYQYDKTVDYDVIGLVFRKDTSIGDYKVTFSQEGIEKASVICRIYESLNAIEKDYISFETNKKAFVNEDYKDVYKSDYIVASGQDLNISVELPESVLISDIVKSYNFSFVVGTSNGEEINEIDGNKLDYFEFKHDNATFNNALLKFIKGTYVDDIQYVYLTIGVDTKVYSDIVTEAESSDKIPSITLSFFIYDEITKKDISINHSNMTRYYSEYLGVYYADQSHAELEILMNEKLWNYVTGVKKSINGSEKTALVDWKIDDKTSVAVIEDSNENEKGVISNLKFGLNFGMVMGKNSYIRTVKAYVYQFENIFELQCVFNVEKPILTERLTINSEMKSTDEKYYINLKNGESYQVDATNNSSKGIVTNSEIVIQVADAYGSAYNAKDYFDVNQTTSTITVKKVDGANNFKLIVFAKDVLLDIVSSDKSGYNMPTSFIKDFVGTEEGMCKNAYFIVDILLSDGTEENPYLITNANDFWEIDDTESYRSAHYWVMNTISLNDTTDENAKTISNFVGSIKSYNEFDKDGNQLTENVFMIDGVVLDDNNKNVFGRFLGTIKDLKFVVDYNYSYTDNDNSETTLGLFASNNGTIENVSVEVSGNAILEGNTTYYFGGLVGENAGQIIYKSGIGVSGKISSLQGKSKVYFGGLVGKNVGKIVGYESQNGGDNEIVINSSTGRDKSISLIEINSSLEGNSAVGGLVGLNTYYDDVDDTLDTIGTISNVFVQATINANNTSNVGGVIGENNQKSNSITLNNAETGIAVNGSNLLTGQAKTMAIYNVKSASTISAKDNVGGVVGLDTNGLYIECDYQILITSEQKTTALKANEHVGGIAGNSTYGKFAYCSVMSYNWNYSLLKTDISNVVTDVADISGVDYVGGIVGFATSSSETLNSGSVSVADRVIVVYSSVNAFVESTKQAQDKSLIGNIGGILTSNGGYSVVYSVYFIGKLSGNVVYSTQTTINGSENTIHYLAIDNNKSSIYNAVYSINIEQTNDGYVAKRGYIKDKDEFIYDEDPNLNYWWHNANINGGFIFVTTQTTGENRLPIFDISPDSIEVSVKGETNVDLKRTLMLKYYDFSSNLTLTDNMLLDLNEQFNRNKYVYKLNNKGENIGELDISVKPEGIGQVVVNVTSTNTNVVDIAYDGRIIINNVGECELIFSSQLNPNAGEIEKRTIKVVVDYPLGNNFKVSTSKTDMSKVVNGSQNIAKGTSKHYYVVTEGVEERDLFDSFGNSGKDGFKEKYYYKTKDNTNLKLEISYDTTINIAEYVSVSGQNGTQSSNAMTILLDNKTPLTISVLKSLESGKFAINIKPYVVINSMPVYYTADGGTTTDEDVAISTEFDLFTKEGATSVALSYDESIVYPNDTIYLTAHLQTDVKLVADDIRVVIENLNSYIKNADGKYEIQPGATIKGFTNGLLINLYNSKNLLKCNVFVDSCVYNEDSQILTISFRLEFSEMELTGEELLLFELSTQNGNSSQVEYTILPQRINKIEIRNYYHKNVEDNGNITTQLVQDDVLKPNYPGEIIIDMVPYNGYYSYLEISDITGNEEILFIQVDESGNALTLSYDPSSDGKGIKLYGQLDKSRLFVRTQISKTYSSKVHTIEVRAYSSNGTLLAKQTKEIDVKMLPEIKVDYMLPDGTVNKSASVDTGDALDDNRTGVYLANGVDANFMVTTQNSNSDLDIKLSGDLAGKYEFVKEAGDHYVLRNTISSPDKDDIGKKIKISFTTYFYLNNGDFEKAECSIEFVIVSFVVHGVSVTNSIERASSQEIYGYYNQEVNLEFYFDKDDISFFDTKTENEPFWDTVYKYEPGIENDYSGNSEHYQIYSILKKLNAYDGDDVKEVNDYLILNGNKKDAETGTYETDVDVSKINLAYNKLSVEEGYNKKLDASNNEVRDDKYLAVAFKLFNENSTWNIETYDKDIDTNYKQYVIDKNYILNFTKAKSWYEPTVVLDEEDFCEMTSGGRYILANDLVLTNYTPIDADLVEFDGNGRTITIQSFASFNEEVINVGLFKQVYPNMIVKNVVVKYQSVPDDGNYTFGYVNKNENKITYTDLCNNPSVNYTSAQFGGVAAINKGIITNCKVVGQIAVNASTIEEKRFADADGNYEINFFVGGVVAENASTGYITHSTSELAIFAQANIGGFAHTNHGKIVSCGVKNVTIYSYNVNLANTIIVKVAGFAVNNSSEISMSYVDLMVDLSSDSSDNIAIGSVKKGTISAKDISAGFVYLNSGNIYDAYVQMNETGINNNTFAGFVYDNSGSVTRAYTYINSGLKVDNNDTMFAPAGTEGLEDCIEIVVVKPGYSSGIEQGLKTLEDGYRYTMTYYQEQNFAFGDNVSAVWSMKSSGIPKLVSTQEEVVYTNGQNVDGLLSFFKKVEIVDGVEKTTYEPNFANYGTRRNPYIIHDLTTWNDYFSNGTYSYYRIVKDIDFSSIGDNPKTSTMTFRGNIQGNNMSLDGIMLYSTSGLEALGLFKSMESANDNSINNAVRNLKLSATSVWASKTSAVGLLSGIIENFNVYNITLDAENVIMVGSNAVGGLAGVVRGEFDIDQISSNIGVNSTRASTLNNYSIYASRNNKKDVSYNIQNVYYAGSVVGILDGYGRTVRNINEDREISGKYYNVRNIRVEGNVVALGDTVGGAFGLVGERTYLTNVRVNISGGLSGSQYSAGVVGENRGIIEDVKVMLADNMFTDSKYVSSGAVGFNLGGLVRNVEVKANISKTSYAHTVAGIVGRNVYGTVLDLSFDGELYGYFTGGILGANYTSEILTKASTGSGALSSECVANTNLVPNKQIIYTQNEVEISNFENLLISVNSLNSMITNSSKYYSYKGKDVDLNKITVKGKVLGVVVGLSYQTLFDDAVITVNDTNITFNPSNEVQTSVQTGELKDVVLQQGEEPHTFNDVRVLVNAKLDKAYVMYLTGARVNSFDSWDRTYSDDYVVFYKSAPTNPTETPTD